MAPYQGIILAVVGLTAAYLGYSVLTSTNAPSSLFVSNDDQHRSLRTTSSMTATLKEQQLDTTNERRARELWTIDPRSVAPRVSNPYVEPNAAQLRNSAFDIRTADFNSAMNVPPLRPIQEEQLLQEAIASSTAPRGRSEVALTSWFTYQDDPQRKGIRVSAESIEYMYNLYSTATHLKVPLVVFHNNLSPQFVSRYQNEYVSFVHVDPADPTESTNDFRFTPYLEYIKTNDVDSVLMVDASDVFFNRNPFEYFREHANEYNLFVSKDQGTFNPSSWNLKECYGSQVYEWDPTVPLMNAGVWGGTGEALRCVLQCVVDQLEGPLKGKGRHNNCNMPAVNFCVSKTVGPCGETGANVIRADPNPNDSFVNPWLNDCLGDYDIVHNKCPDTIALKCNRGKNCHDADIKLCVDSVDGELIKDHSRGMCSRDDDAN